MLALHHIDDFLAIRRAGLLDGDMLGERAKAGAIIEREQINPPVGLGASLD
jgi:hypothetical protein